MGVPFNESKKIQKMIKESTVEKLLELQKLDSECDFLITQLQEEQKMEIGSSRILIDGDFCHKYNIHHESKLVAVISLLTNLERIRKSKEESK